MKWNLKLVPSVLCLLSRSISGVPHHLLQVLNWVKKLSSTHPLSIPGRLEMTQIENHEVKPHRTALVLMNCGLFLLFLRQFDIGAVEITPQLLAQPGLLPLH